MTPREVDRVSLGELQALAEDLLAKNGRPVVRVEHLRAETYQAIARAWAKRKAK